MDFSLNSYIKYCLGYLSLTRPTGFNRGTSLDIKLPEEYFTLSNLLNGDTDGNLSEIIQLNTYYSHDPKDVPEELKEQYEKEKAIALQVDQIYNKAKNDTYTKETLLKFGRFEFEVLEEPITEDETEEEVKPAEETKKPALVKKQFYLFSLPVRVEKELSSSNLDRYAIIPVDFEVRLNLPPLYEIFRTYQKEELVYEFLNEYVRLENEGSFSIPISNHNVFTELWHILKSKLRLTDANFNEQSFDLEDLRLTLAPRSNFFLVEDLTKLSREEEKKLEETSLNSWFTEDGLNIQADPCEEKALYFPFPYDKFQRATTSLLGNKASIIQGPPGTGKSETISNVICHLAVNKNKVLFVSQKAQALRVVKDKLKALDVPLMFGYIPSVKFDQSSDEEADTISAQLGALDTYIQGGVSAHRKVNIETFTDHLETNLTKKDKIISLQRDYFAQDTELQEYGFLTELPDLDEEKVLSNFTEQLFNTYWATKNKIYENEASIEKLESYSKYISFDKELFEEASFSEKIHRVLTDVKKTGFDGSFFLTKIINNTSRKFRLNGEFSSLPKEVRTQIDNILKESTSRHIATKNLDALLNGCTYYECIYENVRLNEQLIEIENNLDLTPEDFAHISDFLKKHSLNVNQLLEALSNRKNIIANKQNINDQIAQLKQEVTDKAAISRKDVVAQYLANVVEENIQKNIVKVSVLRKLQELSKAFKKSKKAFKTFDKLKNDPNNFQTILNIVPIWIMDLDDASRLLPLVPNLFDYVVFDEASQCNIAYTLPSMYRAKKSVFVGDPEQMRDSTVMFKSNNAFEQLATRYKVPDSLQIKPTGNAVQSVLDIAKTRFGLPKILQYHYRSPAELIGFSNNYFYEPKGKRLIALNNKYLTYKDTNRVMVIHNVTYTGIGETGDKTNRAEAVKAFELYQEMKADPKYEGKSFAVLTFFNDQAELIRKVFEENKVKESETLKIAIIEGIQGDEKDVIIYSFVIRDPEQKRQYTPLTGETGDIRAEVNAGRVNVAFSRARLQVHCIVSMPIEKIPTGIWIKNYLEYVRDNGEVSASKLNLKPFDSYFEEEFYNLLKKKLGRKYTIQNQVESCGFKIDFVVTNCDTGKQLAIECDGPTHFKDHIDEAYGIYVESDIQRQRVLESAGWQFFRVGYSEWIENEENKQLVLENVKNCI